MVTKSILSALAIIAFSFQASAQRTPTLAITVEGNKAAVRPGDEVTLKVKGYNEETSTLQWQSSADGKTWKNIAKATGDNFETTASADAQYFRVITKPSEGYLTVQESSNVQLVSLQEEVASSKKKKQ